MNILKSIYNYLVKRKERTLYVFVSSPGDCKVERAAIIKLLNKVSSSSDAKKQGITLKPIKWENLPPGLSEKGNLQLRINSLLKQYGLKSYNIYLGFLKERLGTPTKKFESGTIEEFQMALASYKKRKRPSELLFYFLDYQDINKEETLKYRRKLDAIGFLYHTTNSKEAFLEALETHLTTIISEWYYFKNYLKRQLFRLRLVLPIILALTLSLFLFGYFAYDFKGGNIINSEIENEAPIEVLNAWKKYAPYMILKKNSIRKRVNSFFHESFENKSCDISLDLYKEWSNSSVSTNRQIKESKIILRSKLEEEINVSLYNPSSKTGLNIWIKSEDLSIWDESSTIKLELLQKIAGQKLFKMICSKTNEVIDLEESGLSDYEKNGLVQYCKHILDSINTNSRIELISALVLTESWEKLEILATKSLDEKNDPLLNPELYSFGRYAPPQKVSNWISKNIFKNTTGYLFRKVEDGLRDRPPSPILALAVLKKTALKKTPYNPFEYRWNDEGILGITVQEFPDFASQLLKEYRVWNKETSIKDLSLLFKIFDALPTDSLNQDEKNKIGGDVIKLLETDTSDQIYVSEYYEFLAKLKMTSTNAYLKKQLKLNIGKGIYYNIASREALMNTLRMDLYPPKESMDLAFKLAKRVREEFTTGSSSSGEDGGVQGNYLLVVNKFENINWEENRDYIIQLIKDRLFSKNSSSSLFSFGSSRWAMFDSAMDTFVDDLSEGKLFDLIEKAEVYSFLLRFPDDFSALDYIVQKLQPSEKKINDSKLNKILTLNLSETIKLDFIRKYVADGGDIMSPTIKMGLPENQSSEFNAIVYLKQSYLDLNLFLKDTTKVNALDVKIEIADYLNGKLQSDYLKKLVEINITDEDKRLALLTVCWQYDIKNKKLADLAMKEILSFGIYKNDAINLFYLASQFPEKLNQAISKEFSEEIALSFDTTSIRNWIRIGQTINFPDSFPIPEFVINTVKKRNLLIAFGDGQIEPENKKYYFKVGEKYIHGHFLYMLLKNQKKGVGKDFFLKLISSKPKIDFVGEISDHDNVFSGYCMWLQGQYINDNSKDNTELELIKDKIVLDALGSEKEALVRGSASVILGID